MEPIQIGILGLGHIGRVHIETLDQLDEYKLVALCDRDPALQSLAPQGVEFYTDFERFLREAECDTVVVATPNNTHYMFGRAVIESGRHLVIEKPAASTDSELEELMQRAESNDVHIYFAFHAARAPEVQALKPHINGGLHDSLGPLTGFSCRFHDPYFTGGMLSKAAQSLEQCWYDSGINALSVLAELMDVTALSLEGTSMARHGRRNPEVIQATAFFSFPVSGCNGGGQGVIDTNWTRGRDRKETWLHFGRTGSSLMLSHSEQKIYVAGNSTEFARVEDHSGGRERLVNHYLGVFTDYAAARVCGEFNSETAQSCHSILFSVMHRDREDYSRSLSGLKDIRPGYPDHYHQHGGTYGHREDH